jgi:hypothetical protein
MRRILAVLSLCVAPLLSAVAYAGQSDDRFRAVSEEVRSLEAEVQRFQKEIDGLRRRLDAIEEELAALSSAAAPVPAQRPLPRAFPLPNPRASVDEVLRLQFGSPGRLLNGIREREERLRRRQFPPEIYSTPIRN